MKIPSTRLLCLAIRGCLRLQLEGGQSQRAFSYVLAKRLNASIGSPFAGFGYTTEDIIKQLPAWLQRGHTGNLRQNSPASQTSAPWRADDLVLLHIGGNDIKPCVLTCWFNWWDDDSQREHARSYLRPIVKNIGIIVDTLCGKPFNKIVIAVPPFSKHVPLTIYVTENSLLQLREETERIYRESLGKSTDTWRKNGCEVLLFDEPRELDVMYEEMGLGQACYVDLMHPGAEFHHELGLRMYRQVVGSAVQGNLSIDLHGSHGEPAHCAHQQEVSFLQGIASMPVRMACQSARIATYGMLNFFINPVEHVVLWFIGLCPLLAICSECFFCFWAWCTAPPQQTRRHAL